MEATIDAAGRLVIPKELRRRAGLTAGTKVNIELEDGRIQIEPVYMKVRLEQRGRFLVAVPETPGEPMTDEDVEAIRDALIAERGQ